MRHLYLQFYIALVAILILFGVLVFATWLLLPASDEQQRLLTGSAAAVSDLLPAEDRPLAETQAALDRLHEQLGVSLSLYSADGRLIGAAGGVLPAPDRSRTESGWIRGKGRGPKFALRLTDGRWLVVRAHHDRAASWLAKLALLAIAVAVGAYPIVRRITRRLERLQRRVDQLGAGDLSARVEVQGNDEVAKLARSFNRAADQVERLVEAQRGILAGASHELRTPLTRIRMGVELLAGENQVALRERISRDIRELDELIEELLLASRLSAGENMQSREPVELLALCAEEGARVGASVTGTRATVRGDARTLRRMLRNLFENAQRHGEGASIDASIAVGDTGGARILVCDTGPGVPETERERIFDPFYRASGVINRGSGLGLALVREIARRHGGDVRYLPREGGGSCFEVDIAGQ
jgi:two-component system, OmpR family, sensor histidine kinase RstB